jgi:hypothetical protein
VQDVGVEDHMRITEGLTLRVKAIRRQARLSVTGNGQGLVSRAGTGLVVETAGHLQLEQALATATAGVRPLAVHTPAAVLADLSLMLADGGTRLRHLEVLRGQPGLFGKVASVPTATRTLAALADHDAIKGTLGALDAARAKVRERAWQLGALPAPVAAAAAGDDVGPLCIDLDATLVVAHSDDKDGAAKTYKRTWGFHPMTAWLDRGDGTGEALAIELRKGNAGANSGADQIRVLDRAWGQLPELPDELDVLVRADTAGAVHELVDHIRQVLHARFSVGMRLQGQLRDQIHALEEHDDRWQPAIRQDGTPRKGAAVAELTDLVELSGWPPARGCSCVASRCTPAHSRPSMTSTATGSPPSSPTRATSTSPCSMPATARMPGWRTASAVRRTPGWRRCPVTPSNATSCGASSSSSPPTC